MPGRVWTCSSTYRPTLPAVLTWLSDDATTMTAGGAAVVDIVVACRRLLPVLRVRCVDRAAAVNGPAGAISIVVVVVFVVCLRLPLPWLLPPLRPILGDLAVNRALRSAGSKAKRHNVEYRRAICPPGMWYGTFLELEAPTPFSNKVF